MFIFTLLVYPRGWVSFKLILLAITLILIYTRLLFRRELTISKKIIIPTLLILMVGIFSAIHGLIMNNPGWMEVMKETVIYLAIWILFVPGIIDDDLLIYFHRTLIISTCILLLFTLATALKFFGVWPDYLYYNIYKSFWSIDPLHPVPIIGYKLVHSVGANINDVATITDLIELEFPFFRSFMFIFPYLMTFIIFSKKNTLFQFIILITTGLFMIFSSSKALMLIFIVFTFSILFQKWLFTIKNFIRYRRKTKKLYFLCLILVITYIMTSYFGISAWAYIKNFIEGFSFTNIQLDGNVAENQRYAQFKSLFNSWSERPLLGHGSGAVSYPIRSVISPWAYELTYSQMLFNFGLIGMFIYTASFSYIIYCIISIYKINPNDNIYYLCIMNGSLGFFLGCSTNPILFSFEGIFIFFLLLAIINIYYNGNNAYKSNIR